jgi:hypothetical protein
MVALLSSEPQGSIHSFRNGAIQHWTGGGFDENGTLLATLAGSAESRCMKGYGVHGAAP